MGKRYVHRHGVGKEDSVSGHSPASLWHRIVADADGWGRQEMKLEKLPGTCPGQLNSRTYPSGSGAERNSAQLMFKDTNVLKCSYVMFKNTAPEQPWMTQHRLIAFPGTMLSFLLMLVGGHDVSGQEDHPPGVTAHTSDFHGDLPKSHGMKKAYSEIWKAKFSHAFTYISVLSFFFSIRPTFFYYYSHRIPSCCFFFSTPTEKLSLWTSLSLISR